MLPPFPLRRLLQPTLLLLVLAGLSACSTLQPQAISTVTLKQQSGADRSAAQAEVPPLGAVLTLEEAVARALKYNLQRRALLLEEAIALGQFDLARFDLLPQLMARAGYSRRSEDAITRSTDSVTGEPSLANPHISSAREHSTAELGVSWNLLDFGIGYYTARQQADRVLIAAEHRRRAMHQLTQEVRTAYWRVACAQKLQAQISAGISLAEEALQDARKAETEKIRAPLEALRYQRQLLENLRLLESINQELASARIELMNLINAPLSQNLVVADSAEAAHSPLLERPVEQLEELAIVQNAELREQFYNARIARVETRKVLARLFPSLGFNYGVHYDSDSYLINQRWNEAGVQLSWNLLNLLSAPTQKQLADAGVALADQRRVATQMAVLAQVHIAQLQYRNAYRQFERADAIWSVDSRIATLMSNREEARTQSKLDTVANNTTAILSLLRRYQALAQVHAAASKLQSTLGLEPAIGSMQELTLPQLTQQIQTSLQQWQQGTLPPSAPE